MNILIVEDAKDQRLMLSAVLKKKYKVFEAEDGVKALTVLMENPDIRIVVSDWIMPEMNGIQLCQVIRSNDLGRYVYFILLTGKTNDQDLIKGIECGADDFVSKPVNIGELNARLKAGVRIIELERDLEGKNKALSGALATIEADLEAASSTQEQLLAQPAFINNVNFDWFFKPCKHMGGDMFGYQSFDSKQLCFYQLDVAGHGLPSALFSFTLNNILSESGEGSLCKEKSKDSPSHYIPSPPNKVLEKLNKRFQANIKSMLYFTIVYGVMNTQTGEVVLSQAGHPNPLWMNKKNRTVETIDGSGVPIGMIDHVEYDSFNFTMNPGDRLFLYSDGLTECVNSGDNQFGVRRLSSSLGELFDCSVKGVISNIHERIQEWSKHREFEDDITYLVLEWNP